MKIANSIFDSAKISVINELIALKLPVSEAYKLMKFAKELQEKETTYREAKLKIFKNYGEEIESGENKVLGIKKENEEIAKKELDELMSLEEDYAFSGNIKLPKDVELSAQQLLTIADFVEVE